MVAKDGRVATSINAGLRPPPPAAYGVDSACHPAADCHQEVDGKVRPIRLQMSCRKISLRHLCADPDRRSQGFPRASSVAMRTALSRQISTQFLKHISIGAGGCSTQHAKRILMVLCELASAEMQPRSPSQRLSARSSQRRWKSASPSEGGPDQRPRTADAISTRPFNSEVQRADFWR